MGIVHPLFSVLMATGLYGSPVVPLSHVSGSDAQVSHAQANSAAAPTSQKSAQIAQTTKSTSTPSNTTTDSIAQLLQQAEKYRKTKQYSRAIAIYQRGLPLLATEPNWQLRSRLLFRLGNLHRLNQQHRLAIPHLKQALAIYQKQNQIFSHGYTLRSIGLSYRNLEEYDNALNYLKQAQTVFLKQADRFWQLNSLYDIGNIYLYRQEYAQAIAEFQAALPLAKTLKRSAYVGEMQYKIALSQHDLKQFDAAIANYKASIPLLKAIRFKINAHWYLGKIYRQQERYEAARHILTTGLSIARKTNQRDQELEVLYDLGILYNRLGNAQKAEPLLQTSLKLAKQLQAQHYEQASLQAIGNMLRRRGSYAEAIEYAQRSLNLARKMSRTKGVQGNLVSLGLSHYFIGDYRQAEVHFVEALKSAKATGNLDMQGRIHGNLGLLYRHTEEFDRSLHNTQQSLRIARQLKNRTEEASTLLDLGLLYQAQGKLQAAIDTYSDSLEIAQAIEHQAIIGRIYGNLSTIYQLQEKYDQAAKAIRSSIQIAQTSGDIQSEGIGRTNLGTLLLNQKQFAAAEQEFRASIEIWEQQRQELNRNQRYNTVDRQKFNLFERQRLSYRHLQVALIHQLKVESALEVAEQARTQALVELMSRRKSKFTRTDSTTANVKNNIINASKINIQKIKKIAKQQNATIVEYSVITKDTTLLIWVIQPTGEVDLRLVDLSSLGKTDLRRVTLANRNNIGARGRSRSTRVSKAIDLNNNRPPGERLASKTMYKALIRPIQDLLPKDAAQQVIFIPHKFLFNVPFAAIPLPDGKYLIDRYTIRTAPSIQVLGLSTTPQIANRNQALFKRALIVGNPTMPTISDRRGRFSETLRPLPHAETEVKQIAQIINTTALIGQAATKSSVLDQLPQAKLIHLATHGLLDDFEDLGVPGAIALAPDGTGQANDGILTTDELMDTRLKLNADLVVLSACNTGQGTIKSDGVIGLSRAFLGAGVASVVVSLWAVDDASTAMLMTEFYRNLQTTSDRAVALRQAMLTTREKYPNPHDWAGFTLIGQR